MAVQARLDIQLLILINTTLVHSSMPYVVHSLPCNANLIMSCLWALMLNPHPKLKSCVVTKKKKLKSCMLGMYMSQNLVVFVTCKTMKFYTFTYHYSITIKNHFLNTKLASQDHEWDKNGKFNITLWTLRCSTVETKNEKKTRTKNGSIR